MLGSGSPPYQVRANDPAERSRPFDVAQAADCLTVSVHFVRRLLRERRISSVEVGRPVRFDPDDLDQYIDAGRRSAL
tara:strand:+ start:413 stop:643 length:231 start_codon:yes stop_codon:yes gene_type:complete